MNAKSILRTVLLLFVAVAVVVLVGREVQRTDSEVAAAELPDDALVVYYFHGNTRCPTCRDIESFSHEAVQAGFAEQLASDKVQWRVVNYETPENTHFATEYEIIAPTVVLVRTAAGQVAGWRNLDRVWELVGDRDAFIQYVQQEAHSMIDS